MSIEAQLATHCPHCQGSGRYRSEPSINCSCPAGRLTASVDLLVSRIEPQRARIVIIETKAGT